MSNSIGEYFQPHKNNGLPKTISDWNYKIRENDTVEYLANKIISLDSNLSQRDLGVIESKIVKLLKLPNLDTLYEGETLDTSSLFSESFLNNLSNSKESPSFQQLRAFPRKSNKNTVVYYEDGPNSALSEFKNGRLVYKKILRDNTPEKNKQQELSDELEAIINSDRSIDSDNKVHIKLLNPSRWGMEQSIVEGSEVNLGRTKKLKVNESQPLTLDDIDLAQTLQDRAIVPKKNNSEVSTSIKEDEQPQVEKRLLPNVLPNTDNQFVRAVSGTKRTVSILNDDGKITTLQVSKTNTDKNSYITDDGIELILIKSNQKDIFKIANKQNLSKSLTSTIIKPSKGSFLISAPYADFEKSKEFLANNGLEIQAIVGTGPIGKAPKALENSEFSNGVSVQAGYQYLNLGRLNGNKSTPVVRNHTLLQQDFLAISGIYTTKDKKTHHLDFRDLTSLTPSERIKIRNQRITALENREDVISISLDAFPEGQVSGKGRKEVPQARTIRCFGKDGTYLGSIFTPGIGLGDARLIADDVYGDQLGTIDNPDGDFYSKYYIPGSVDDGSSAFAKRFAFATLLVKPASKQIVEKNQKVIDKDPTPSQEEFDSQKKTNQLSKFFEYAKRGQWDAICGKLMEQINTILNH